MWVRRAQPCPLFVSLRSRTQQAVLSLSTWQLGLVLRQEVSVPKDALGRNESLLMAFSLGEEGEKKGKTAKFSLLTHLLPV